MFERGYYDDYSFDGFNQFMIKTFGWMAAGLAITAVVAFLTLFTGLYYYILRSSIGLFLLLGIELFLCFKMNGAVMRMDSSSAMICFFAYCTTTGITFSTLALIYSVTTMFLAFAYTGVMFACLAAIAKTTDKDITGWGPTLSAGLLTILIISVVNGLFLRLPAMDTMLSYLVIGIFMVFTVFDIQNLKRYYLMYGNQVGTSAMGIYGAFQLYLDFINIFLRVLQLLARRDNRR